MVPSNRLSCETGSFSHRQNHHRILQPEVLRLSFPMLEPWVAQSVSLSSCSSQFICTPMWNRPVRQPLPHHTGPAATPCHASYLPWVLISSPPTSLGECFFFNSLVVGLPYSQSLGSSGCFLFLNWLLSFFWLYKEVKSICLRLHLGRKPGHHLLRVLNKANKGGGRIQKL